MKPDRKKVFVAVSIVFIMSITAMAVSATAQNVIGGSTISLTVRIPPGGYYAVFYNGKNFTLNPMPILQYKFPPVAIKALEHVPAWIRPLLAKQFHLLMMGEVKVPKNSSIAVADINGDGLPDLIVGSGDGKLYFYINVGTKTDPEFKPDGSITVLPGGGNVVPAVGDVTGDGLPDIVVGLPNGNLVLYKNVGTKTSPKWVKDPTFFLGFNFGANASPCLFDAFGNGRLDVAVGNAQGIITLLVNEGMQNGQVVWKVDKQYFPAWKENWYNGWGWHWEGVWVGENARPTIAKIGGVMYLLVGTSDGKIYVFKNSGWGVYPTWAKLGPLPGIEFKGQTSPCLADVTGDGMPDLFIGVPSGEVYFIQNLGNAHYPNFKVWESGAEKMILAQWFWGPAYYPAIETLPSVQVTTKYVDYYANLILNTSSPYIDEVAYSIACDRPTNLKILADKNSGYLYVLNAESIYEMAKKVKYAKIVDFNGWSTLEYKTPTGWKLVPKQIYYKYLVMFNRYILAPWAWPNLYAGHFFRTWLPYDTRYNVSLFQRVANATTLYQAAYLVDYWLRVDIKAWWHPGPKPPGWYRIYLNLRNPKAGIWCGEFSIIYEVSARAMLIPTINVVDIAEDHQFDNFWYNGSWHHVDASSGSSGPNGSWKIYFDPPRGIAGWYNNSKNKGFTYPMEWEEDGMYDIPWRSTIPYAPPGMLANVHVHVVDENGRPIDGARVEIWSHWAIEHHYCSGCLIGGFNFTDMYGNALLPRVGLGRTHNFTIVVTSRIGSVYFGVTIDKGGNYYFNVTIPGRLPEVTSPAGIVQPQIVTAILSANIQIVGGEQHPPDWIGILYRILGYHYFYELPSSECKADVYVMSLSQFHNFLNNVPFLAYGAYENVNHVKISYLALGPQSVIVISNRKSVTTTITVKMTLRIAPPVVYRLPWFLGKFFVGSKVPPLMPSQNKMYTVCRDIPNTNVSFNVQVPNFSKEVRTSGLSPGRSFSFLFYG